jgi:hypothetical protein
LATASFFRWGHWGAQSLDVSTKYATAVTHSWSPAACGGDEEDVGVGSGDEGRGRRDSSSAAWRHEGEGGPRGERSGGGRR